MSDATYWDQRFQHGWSDEPSPFLLAQRQHLPRAGRALDVAGGPGRQAIWLAAQGLDTTVIDVSPVALDMARQRAAAAGVQLNLRHWDLTSTAIPAGPWALICNFYYLQRSLIPKYIEALSPGGLLVFAHATRTNLERHERPGPNRVLEPGELADLTRELKHLYYEENWFSEGRHEARLVARRHAGNAQ